MLRNFSEYNGVQIFIQHLGHSFINTNSHILLDVFGLADKTMYDFMAKYESVNVKKLVKLLQ